MDLNIVSRNLEKEYNCKIIAIIHYNRQLFLKVIENNINHIKYRYFKVEKNNIIKEIVDELLLTYFKEKNEIHLVEYY